ncbi:MAG: radical SAM protein [Nitrospinaceae bacterium]|nr:MAG: radical SAM protein [Nitrospinaceae bacterium]
MKVNEFHCKTILTRTSGYLKPVSSHSLNPYVGCGFGRSACGEGCYVRFNQWLVKGREWGRFIDVKTNADEVYLRTVEKERSWAQKNRGSFSIFFSSSTDPWQPVEKKFRVTRRLLEAMHQAPPDQLTLQTHSASLLDDVERIQTLSRLCDLRVHLSIEGDRDRLDGLPPPPCPLEERMDALKQLSDSGISTVACLSPLYPMIAPEAFFFRLSEMGITAVVIDHFIQGDGTPDGSRTMKTKLPEAMAETAQESLDLSYRDAIARIAIKYLPVGISASGFAGHYSGPVQ